MATGEHSLKDKAVSFLRLASSGKVRDAYERYVGPAFRHHNAFFPGDRESLMKAMEENAAKNPDKLLDVKLALQDGHYVACTRTFGRTRAIAAPPSCTSFVSRTTGSSSSGTWAKRFRRTRRTGTACSNGRRAPTFRTCRRNTRRRHKTSRPAARTCLARPPRRCDR